MTEYRRLRVALLGAGAVGSQVAALLLRHGDELADRAGAEGIISLGGAHSNHLHALAAAGKRLGFKTVGLLRGHEQETPTVQDLQAFGMQLHWLGYGGYRARHEPGFWKPWLAQYPTLHAVPEGGGGLSGALGCVALKAQVDAQLSALGWRDYQAWWLACGTGTTLAGLLLAGSQLRRQLAQLRSGVRDAGGLPLVFPMHPLQESARRPTAAEVAELARFIQSRVHAEFGLVLQPEPVLLGVEL